MNWKNLFAMLLVLVSANVNAADMEYTVSEKPIAEDSKPIDENLMGWAPMSIEALGYDIREVWRQSEMVICISFPR